MRVIAVLALVGCGLIAWLGGFCAPLPPGARWE